MSDELDLNEVKAGDYELLVLSWDETTSKPGQPFDYVTHRQGDIVTLDKEQARRLLAAGAVKAKGKKEKADKSGDGNPPLSDELDISKPIDVVTAWVNGGASADEVKARAEKALDAETEAKGDKAREGLVSKLNAILEPDPS